MATTPPPRPQSPLSHDDILRERERLIQYETVGLCGRFTHFFLRNITLIVLLVVSLIALFSYFPALVDPSLLTSGCKMHHDEFLGKLWLECPAALRRAFGPRRY